VTVFFLPSGCNSLEIEWRELALYFVLKSEIEHCRFVCLTMWHYRSGFARIVVAVMVKKTISPPISCCSRLADWILTPETASERIRRVAVQNI